MDIGCGLVVLLLALVLGLGFFVVGPDQVSADIRTLARPMMEAAPY